MNEPRDWPLERPAQGTLRPWFLSAVGYLVVLFPDAEGARRAQHGLMDHGVPESDIRLYTSDQIRDIRSRLQQERSTLAKAVAAFTIDQAALTKYLDTAKAGGAVLWLYAPTQEDADRLLRRLVDYDYADARYYGEGGVETIGGSTD
jgi:hypothetical protein